MFVYSLTNLTGSRRNQERYMVIATAEVKRRTLLVNAAAVLAGLVLAVPFMLLLGGYALLIIPGVVIPAANFLILDENRNGLKVSRLQSMKNRRKSMNGVFFINGEPFFTPQFIQHVPVIIDSPETKGADELTELVGNPYESPEATIAPVIGRRSEGARVREVQVSDFV